MQVVAIVAEYNPFHNGHAYQIGRIKEMLPDCAIISVMSGSLVQRGEFALVSKYNRARAAVLCGVDAVFELPSVYSCAPANLFARAAVYIIKNLGADYMSFGSECADLELLKFAADNYIKLDGESRDKNYARSFYEAFRNLYGENKARVFTGSNDILGVEYLRALKEFGCEIKPLVIERTGDDYIKSAGDIRACVNNIVGTNCVRPPGSTNPPVCDEIADAQCAPLRLFMPELSYKILDDLIKSGKTADINNISAAVISHINRLAPCKLAEFAEVCGGFEYKIKKSCGGIFDYDDLIKSLASKHVTSSQVKRMILNIFFEITRQEQKRAPVFTNLLCANKTGLEYLNKIKKSAGINIISRPGAFIDNKEYAKNIFIDNIYKLALFDKSGEISAVKEKPVIL